MLMADGSINVHPRISLHLELVYSRSRILRRQLRWQTSLDGRASRMLAKGFATRMDDLRVVRKGEHYQSSSTGL
jgi:hypothetical protein